MRLILPIITSILFSLLANITVTEAGGLPPGFEKWESQCAQNDPKSCFFFAHRLMGGDQIRKDPNRAIGYYQKACKLGLPDACYYAGRHLYYGENGVSADKTGSIPYLAQACKNYSKKWVCYNTAYELLHNPKIVHKPKDAFYFAYLGCKGNDKKSCGLAGYLALGNEGGDRHLKHALTYLENGCELGNAGSCHQLADLYTEGQEIKPDMPRALNYAKKASKLDPKDGQHAYLAGYLLAMDEQYNESIPYSPKHANKDMGMHVPASAAPFSVAVVILTRQKAGTRKAARQKIRLRASQSGMLKNISESWSSTSAR